MTIPPFIIYKGEAQYMGWNDYEENREAVFALSSTGWLNDNLGLRWLKEHFYPNTCPDTSSAYRLLLFDGHRSHLTFEFVEFALPHHIRLVVFPPHSTHLLQPLDVGSFSPLQRFVGPEVHEWGRKEGPYARLHKRDFYPMLMSAQTRALTSSNSLSAFRATGICPMNRLRILRDPSLQIPDPSAVASCRSPTRVSEVDEISQLQAVAQKSHDIDGVKAAMGAIASIGRKGLATATINADLLKQEKEKRQASKRDRRVISKAQVIGLPELAQLQKKKLEGEAKKRDRKIKTLEIELTTASKRKRNALVNELKELGWHDRPAMAKDNIFSTAENYQNHDSLPSLALTDRATSLHDPFSGESEDPGPATQAFRNQHSGS